MKLKFQSGEANELDQGMKDELFPSFFIRFLATEIIRPSLNLATAFVLKERKLNKINAQLLFAGAANS